LGEISIRKLFFLPEYREPSVHQMLNDHVIQFNQKRRAGKPWYVGLEVREF